MARSGRHLARRCAVQALYQWQITGQESEQIMQTFISNESLNGKDEAFFQKLMEHIPLNIEKIDELIESHLDRAQDRIDPVEQAIIRLGTYELQYDQSIPVSVVIDEAIDLAKTFGAKNGYRYVNGVLDKVAKSVRE